MKINTYGLKMLGLRKICILSKNKPAYSRGYGIELAYDPATGRIHYAEHVGDSFTKWPDGMIPCGWIRQPMTMQTIAAQVGAAVWRRQNCVL